MKPVIATFALSALISASAQANFVTHPLIGHAGAGISGTSPFIGAAANGGTIDVNVDYAVFAPGAFTANGGAFTPFGGFGPLSPTDYVYAYQIYNNGPAHQGTGNVEISSLNIVFGPFGSVSSLGNDPGFDPDPNDINATLAFNFSPTASYLFIAPNSLGVDEFSTVLLLSSPLAPALQNASYVIDGGTTVTGVLPAPVPEPGTLVLALVTAGLMLKRRRPAA
jgi:hypothetical protein